MAKFDYWKHIEDRKTRDLCSFNGVGDWQGKGACENVKVEGLRFCQYHVDMVNKYVEKHGGLP